MACEHGCAYCDGRAEKYYVDGVFDRDIVARANAPELLAQELPKLRERGYITLGSGVSDVYQPSEREEQLTRACLEVLADHDLPVTVMTKSHLVLRDLDLWRAIARRSGAMIIVSLTFADDSMREWFEPGASSVKERLDVLRKCKEAGCDTGVLAMPLLPFITDTEYALSDLYKSLEAVGPDFVMPAGLTLRPGRQKAFFLERLGSVRPDLLCAYRDIYRENRPSGIASVSYRRGHSERLHRAIVESRIPFHVPHRIYAGRLHGYDALQVLFAHMDELYTVRGVDTSPLREARARYLAWLDERKRIYNRRPSMSFADLDGELMLALASGELEEVLANPRLADLVSSILRDGKTFDYVELSLSD